MRQNCPNLSIRRLRDERMDENKTFLELANRIPPSDKTALRDWFAGIAILSNAAKSTFTDVTAKFAYKLADEMLAERSKNRKE